VVRGGGWAFDAVNCRAAYRDRGGPRPGASLGETRQRVGGAAAVGPGAKPRRAMLSDIKIGKLSPIGAFADRINADSSRSVFVMLLRRGV
jgi:hypothetical protein